MESEAFTKERIWHGAILCSGFEENEQKTFDSITLTRLGLEQNEQKSTSILTPSQAMKQYAFVDKVETAISAPICQNTFSPHLVKNELRVFSESLGPPPSST